jgi:hypothetical protein
MGCQIFPADNFWNVQVDGPAVTITHAYDSELPQTTPLHPDFGDWSHNAYGIPFSVVPAAQADIPVTFTLWANESDPGPNGWTGADPVATNMAMGTTGWPFFQGMHVEGNPAPGGAPGSLPNDQHGLVIQQGACGCMSYEAWNCLPVASASATCANGAKFNLTSNALRPAGFTSGDAAGLSIVAGLVKISEVNAGVVTHAIRVTFDNTQAGYIPPATHAANEPNAKGPVGSAYPPMGLRLRMKASVNISGYSSYSQIIMTAMKKYGLVVADIGTDWYFQGDSDDGWIAMVPGKQNTTIMDEIVADFGNIQGSDFEVVYTGQPVNTNL